jgi:hypothetical protein
MITIEIKTDNSAFEDDLYDELARIFEDIASYVQERRTLPRKLYDTNGNACGTVQED